MWWVQCGLWGFQGFGYQTERSASECSVLQELWALQHWDPCLTIFHFIMSSIISAYICQTFYCTMMVLKTQGWWCLWSDTGQAPEFTSWLILPTLIPKLLLLFSCPIMSDSLRLHGQQHTRLPCPSLFPWACSNSYQLSHWWYPTISSSVVPFSSCLQSFLASDSFLRVSSSHQVAKVLDLQHQS